MRSKGVDDEGLPPPNTPKDPLDQPHHPTGPSSWGLHRRTLAGAGPMAPGAHISPVITPELALIDCWGSQRPRYSAMVTREPGAHQEHAPPAEELRARDSEGRQQTCWLTACGTARSRPSSSREARFVLLLAAYIATHAPSFVYILPPSHTRIPSLSLHTRSRRLGCVEDRAVPGTALVSGPILRWGGITPSEYS